MSHASPARNVNPPPDSVHLEQIALLRQARYDLSVDCKSKVVEHFAQQQPNNGPLQSNQRRFQYMAAMYVGQYEDKFNDRLENSAQTTIRHSSFRT